MYSDPEAECHERVARPNGIPLPSLAFGRYRRRNVDMPQGSGEMKGRDEEREVGGGD